MSKTSLYPFMREAGVGLALGAVTCLGLWLLPNDWARDAAANLLTMIAAIYIGFSIASHGKLPLTKEVVGCAFFIMLALLGTWLDWWFLVAGLALHGVWDYLHRGEHGHGVVPQWYVPFCAIYDWTIALFISLFFAM